MRGKHFLSKSRDIPFLQVIAGCQQPEVFLYHILTTLIDQWVCRRHIFVQHLQRNVPQTADFRMVGPYQRYARLALLTTGIVFGRSKRVFYIGIEEDDPDPMGFSRRERMGAMVP